MKITHCSFLALTMALVAAPNANADTTIGAVGAANQTIKGTPPGADPRVLLLGANVIQNERIATSESGSGQIIFADQTTLSVAPDSEIVLDRYVYDPDRSSGEIGLSITRGALRFIGGRITKNKQGIIRTPAATIGIRGGAAVIEVDDTDAIKVVHVAGEWTRITSGGETLDLHRTGATVIVGDDQKPALAGIASPAEIDALYTQFEGGGGGLSGSLDPDAAAEGVQSGVTGFAGSELGGENRQVVATSGASMIENIPPDVNEGQYQNIINSPELETQYRTEGPSEPPPPPPPPPEVEERETPLPGVSGVAIFASSTPFSGDNGGIVNDPAGQNVLASRMTIDPLAEVNEGQRGFVSGSGFDPFLFSRNGYNADGDRYLVPVNPAGGVNTYTEGESPLVPSGIDGTSNHTPAREFTTAFYEEGARSRVFFGRGTPGQLGTAQGSGGPQQRTYSLRDDPFLNSSIPMLDDSIAMLFNTPPTVELDIIEEEGEGLFRENGERGFAKAGIGVLGIEGVGPEQTSLFLIGTGRVTPTSDGAPSPDLGLFGTVQTGETASPDTISATTGLLATGDGSTVFGPNGENLVLASVSRFIFDGDEDYEITPTLIDSWDGTTPDPRGFAHVGDLDRTRDIDRSTRLQLGVPFGSAVELNGFNAEDDDTALTGGYAAALGRSNSGGTVSDSYVMHSDSTGARMSFDASQNEANAALNLVGGPSQTGSFNGETGAPTSGEPTNTDIETASFGFGSRSTRSTMINDREFLLRNRTTTDLGFVPGNTQINNRTGPPTPTGGEQQAFRGALASTGAVGTGGQAVFASNVDTEHEYLRWGYWSGEFSFGADDDPAFNERQERYHLGTFVTGNRLDGEFLPSSGTASFDGFAVVSVTEGGSDYVDGGGFAMNYNFGTRSGQANFTDLAGYDFAASVSGNTFTVIGNHIGQDHYAGSINSAGSADRPAVAGSVAGSFFTDADSASLANDAIDVRATAGRIDFQSTGDGGAGLRASGVFGGDVAPDQSN